MRLYLFRFLFAPPIKTLLGVLAALTSASADQLTLELGEACEDGPLAR
jgi:hypothetical protein